VNLRDIGLGTGYRLPASMGGEPNFDGQANSLWLYQNDIGEVIDRAIYRREVCSITMLWHNHFPVRKPHRDCGKAGELTPLQTM
jgi:hypothetical protein